MIRSMLVGRVVLQHTRHVAYKKQCRFAGLRLWCCWGQANTWALCDCRAPCVFVNKRLIWPNTGLQSGWLLCSELIWKAQLNSSSSSSSPLIGFWSESLQKQHGCSQIWWACNQQQDLCWWDTSSQRPISYIIEQPDISMTTVTNHLLFYKKTQNLELKHKFHASKLCKRSAAVVLMPCSTIGKISKRLQLPCSTKQMTATLNKANDCHAQS